MALGLVGLIGSAMIIGAEGATAIGATTTWDSLTNYTLTMLPLFVLMGVLADECEPVSTRAGWLPLMPCRDGATQREQRRGSS